MFGPYDLWNGEVDFTLFEFIPQGMETGTELRVANFEMIDSAAFPNAPSTSLMPSSSPTTTAEPGIGYILCYAGQVRTVTLIPFQDDRTGDFLPMYGSISYQFCELDAVEGKFGEFPNHMNLLYNDQCVPIQGGNPTVNLYPTYVNTTDLNILDLSTQPSSSLYPINEDQTHGGDWLLASDVNDELSEVCATLPSPYDNDYKGGDHANPDRLASRFDPDKPVFSLLPDGSHARDDLRHLLHENTLEVPLMEGGGALVLRSTMGGTKKFAPTDDGGYVFHETNRALCVNEQPNLINRDTCKLSYEANACAKTANALNDVSMVITLDDATLVTMYDATNTAHEDGTVDPHYICAVSNLQYDGSNTDGIVIALPCSPGNPTLRWIPRTVLMPVLVPTHPRDTRGMHSRVLWKVPTMRTNF